MTDFSFYFIFSHFFESFAYTFLVGGALMNTNNEMLYSMLLNSIKTMSDSDIHSTLEKAKGMMSASDYEKLLQIVKKERNQSF